MLRGIPCEIKELVQGKIEVKAEMMEKKPSERINVEGVLQRIKYILELLIIN